MDSPPEEAEMMRLRLLASTLKKGDYVLVVWKGIDGALTEFYREKLFEALDVVLKTHSIFSAAFAELILGFRENRLEVKNDG